MSDPEGSSKVLREEMTPHTAEPYSTLVLFSLPLLMTSSRQPRGVFPLTSSPEKVIHLGLKNSDLGVWKGGVQGCPGQY